MYVSSTNQRSPGACRQGRARISSGVNRCTHPINRHVIDGDAPFRQQLLHVAIGQPVAEIPPHRPMPLSLAGDLEEMDLGRVAVELAVVGSAFEAVVVSS